MGLIESLRRLVGGGSDADEGPVYECSTCGRQYDERRTVCLDCNSRVQEVTPG